MLISPHSAVGTLTVVDEALRDFVKDQKLFTDRKDLISSLRQGAWCRVDLSGHAASSSSVQR